MLKKNFEEMCQICQTDVKTIDMSKDVNKYSYCLTIDKLILVNYF